MLRLLIASLLRNSCLRLLLAGCIVSSIGSGLTYIIIFGEMNKLNASPSSFAVAFIIAIAPAFLGSTLGVRILTYMEPKHLFILSEVVGIVSLLIPWYGISQESVFILQFSDLIVAFSSGMIVPVFDYYLKSQLSDDETGVASVLDTLLFASHVLFGILVGSLLYGYISNFYYLIADCLSCVMAMLLFMFLPTVGRDSGVPQAEARLPSDISNAQRISLYILPALTLVGTPAMSLLPTLVNRQIAGSNSMLFFLVARSLGQLMGPLLISQKIYETQSKSVIFICMAFFVGLYLVLPFSPFLAVSLLLVFCAHSFSNVVFTLGTYAMFSNFDSRYIAIASAISNRRQIIISSVISLLVGVLADHVGSTQALFYALVLGYLIASSVLIFASRKNSMTE